MHLLMQRYHNSGYLTIILTTIIAG